MKHVPVSIVIPTIGRPAQLRACLESLAVCRPAAAEILVVDQSADDSVARLVSKFAALGARRISCSGRGVGRARNRGFSEARHDTVLVTDDDCTVRPDWVEKASELVATHPDTLITGRVLPAGDPAAVPSTIDDPNARDYTNHVFCNVLFPNNMTCAREDVLALGGFDDRVLFAEDNDFCYRWLRAGRRMRYEPDLVVWHHDWRSRRELEQLYVAYGRGQGRFYAKHLRARDITMLRFLAADLYAGLRAIAAAAIRGRRDSVDPRPLIMRGLPVGLASGWREFRREPERTTATPRA